MNEVFETKAKKISVDQVEVVDANGAHVAGKDNEQQNPFTGSFGTGNFKVVKMGPMGALGGLLLLPIIIPVAIIGFFLVMILAMFFGKAFLRSTMTKVIRR